MKTIKIEKWNKDNFRDNILKKTQLILVDMAHFDAVDRSIYNGISKAEIEKSERFFHKKDKVSYLMGKYMLRLLLSEIESVPATAIDFLFTVNKKPFFKSHEFNITHSYNHIYIAFSPLAVGVDAEKINTGFNVLPIVETCFSHQERALYEANKSYISFYKIWTRKEALLKATGEGLCNNMKEIVVLDDLVSRNGKLYTITTRKNKDYILSVATLFHHKQMVCMQFDALTYNKL